MRIAGTHYNLNHKALEIFISGCKEPHCKGCHNQELWDFEIGRNSTSWIRKEDQKIQNSMVQKIWILGGEPLDQDIDELRNFLGILGWRRAEMDTEFWLWTRYEVIPPKISKYLTHAKIGEYREELPSYVDEDYGIELASENQRIIKL